MPGLSLDAPPPLSSPVAAQMGGGGDQNPYSGMGGMAAGNPTPPSPAGPDAGGGALKAQVDAVKAVLEKIIQSSGAGKTYFSRAAQLLEQGLAVESQAGPGTPPSPQPDAGKPEGMSRPPAASFAG